jgi:hypothetical protein
LRATSCEKFPVLALDVFGRRIVGCAVASLFHSQAQLIPEEFDLVERWYKSQCLLWASNAPFGGHCNGLG